MDSSHRYAPSFLEAFGRTYFSPEHFTDIDIAREFGTNPTVLGERRLSKFRSLLTVGAGAMVDGMLNAQIYWDEYTIKHSKDLRGDALAAEAAYEGGDSAPLEALATDLKAAIAHLRGHDVMHCWVTLERRGTLRPTFMTATNRINNRGMLEEEWMTLLFTFGEEREPSFYTLMDPEKSRAQSATLQTVASVDGTPRLMRALLEERASAYRAAADRPLTFEETLAAYHTDCSAIFRIDQLENAEKRARAAGHADTRGDQIARFATVNKKYSQITDDLRTNPDPLLIERLTRIYASNANPLVLFGIWEEMVNDFFNETIRLGYIREQ